MTTIPFWIDSAPIKRFPTLQKNMHTRIPAAKIVNFMTLEALRNWIARLRERSRKR